MIAVGTCSWTERTLIRSGEFYPGSAATAEERLRYYSSVFPTVEVDSTFYAIPSLQTAWYWAQRTSETFVFHIKAYGALTGHGVNPKTVPAELRERAPERGAHAGLVYVKEKDKVLEIGRRFSAALGPLARSGKLGCIVFQFPPWFRYSSVNLETVAGCRQLVGDFRVAVEFRHGSWLTPERAPSVFAFLREHGLVYVAADEPQYGTLATVPFLPAVTSDVGYFRFHGRNRENWLKRGIETSLRYDYRYADTELAGFIASLRDCEPQAAVVYAMFNNCHGASAVRNAMRMQEMIDGARA